MNTGDKTTVNTGFHKNNSKHRFHKTTVNSESVGQNRITDCCAFYSNRSKSDYYADMSIAITVGNLSRATKFNRFSSVSSVLQSIGSSEGDMRDCVSIVSFQWA